MPSTFFGLTIGTSGLYTYQAALNTTAHNIANTDTEGYSRQQVVQSATTPLSSHNTYGMIGTGVNVDEIKQIRDFYYDVKYWNNKSMCGEYDAKNYYMKSIENYISEVNANGINTSFDEFSNMLQSLSTDGANLTMRTSLARYGTTFTDYLNNLSTSLSFVQSEVNTEIKTCAKEINNISKQIASLNKQINTIEIRGENANDLRDARALLVDQLSEYANVTVTEETASGLNRYIVRMDGRSVVDTYDYNTLVVKAEETNVNQNDISGLYHLEWQDGQYFDSNSESLGGRMAALFQVRDGNNLENFKGKFSELDSWDEGSVVVVKGTNAEDINKLALPAEDGLITISNTNYTYDHFTMEIDPEDKSYTYSFYLKQEVTADYEENAEVRVGQSIDYKGIPYYQNKLNEFIRTYAQAFNSLHNQGEDLNGEHGLDFFTAKDAATGQDYRLVETDTVVTENGTLAAEEDELLTEEQLKELEEMENRLVFSSFPATDEEGQNLMPGTYYYMTAKNVKINAKILEEPSKVACASHRENGVEDVDILKKILELKSDEQMFKQGTPNMYLQSFTAEVGVDAKKAKDFSNNQENILEAVDNQRMSISGVDEDDEAMDLVKFQNAYNLSAKVVQTMNAIYDKLINYMGV